MTSLRSKIVKRGLKAVPFFGQTLTANNLAVKRVAYAKTAKWFPVSRRATFRSVQKKAFKGEWIDTPHARPDKAMLYIHGGGFVFDSMKLHRDLISRIAAAGRVRAFSLDYSLAPEHPFPAQVDEALAAYQWLLLSFNSADIVFAGDSAGGTIVLSLLHAIRERNLPYPSCAVVMSPPTDGVAVQPKPGKAKDFFISHANRTFFLDSYLRDTPRNHSVASPIHGALHGFPPLLIQVDKDELIYAEAKRFADKAKNSGVDVSFYESQNLWHVWQLFGRFVPEARLAIRQIGDFISVHTK